MKRSSALAAWAVCLWVVQAALAQGEPLRQAYEKPASAWPAPWIDESVAFVELGAQPPSLRPASIRSAAMARLGAQLFVDPRLSADGRVSCASCHRPDQGRTVRTPTARGVAGPSGRRNPPSLYGVATRLHWAWDGAGRSLPAQSLRPLTDPREMGNASLDAVWQRLRGAPEYAALTRVDDPARMGDALAAFQRTLHTNTRFDRFARGDARAFTDQQIRGLHLFRTKARCANCHFGPTLSDDKFHNLGIAFFGEPSQDLGRFGVTGQCDDVARFRTPSLRHVAQTAPYMHHGLFDSLAGVLHLYARGGGDARSGRASVRSDPLYACALRVSPHLQPLPLSIADIEALRAFLQAL
ncbi:cytochrome c peroxidase [Hydrogenophaga sp. 2FB]|uniref:cytochrome-c peroxidase n=1 Tax=Hydrogenophaga sp. 2FB TaxID=2502187 RepID=UPI001BB2AA24|nr:cytochrome c peroxidase [Hydrogenophaga sp. 2FB]